MSILPSWPIAAGALVLGLAGGFYAEHVRLGAQIDRIQADHAEEERQRQLVRADDEREARTKEQQLAARAGQIEQEKTDEIARVRSSADALVDRLRKQTASKPTGAGGVPTAGAACAPATGADVPVGSGEGVVRLAERADVIRAGLAACYQWADALTSPAQQPDDGGQRE